MKRKVEPHNGCDNCKHFIMHFHRSQYNYYVVFKCGECRIRKYTEEEKEKLPYEFVCDKWTPQVYANIEISAINDELRDITAKLILIVKALSK